MKQWQKGLLALGCGAALVIGTAAAAGTVATRQLEAQYMDIKLVVRGQAVEPVNAGGQPVEPFAVDGTVYLPVRAVGEALGQPVEWDPETCTVYVGQPPMAEDAAQLTAALELSHPAFALGTVPEGYEAAKEALLAKAKEPGCTLADFTWAAMACAAALEDAHTSVDPFGGIPQPSLDISWAAQGDGLYLLDEGGALTGAEVTAVGGISTGDLFAVIDTCTTAENQAGRDRNHARWAASPAMLQKAGAAFGAGGTLALTVLEDGRTATRMVGLTQPASGEGEPVITSRNTGAVYYVDFNQCVDNEDFQRERAALEEAVRQGTRQVILDIRGNGGGNSDTCVQLLNALGMTPPDYGAYVRYSPLAQQTYPQVYSQSGGGERFAPDPGTARANPDIDLVVLTDEDTFSSATMLAVYVRDGGLGTLVGRPSANRPSHYGDLLWLSLDNAGLGVRISHKQWLRPDQTDASDTLTPDIETALGEDALERALEFLRQT